MEQKNVSQVGRRDVIKKSAVAGAIVWTAPAILSSRALATHTGTHVCANTYIFKLEGGACTTANRNFCPTKNLAVANAANPNVCLTKPTNLSNVVTNCTYSEASGGTFRLQPGFYPIGTVGKKGSSEVDGSQCTTFGPPSLSGGTYQTVTGESHVYVIVCGPAVAGTCY